MNINDNQDLEEIKTLVFLFMSKADPNTTYVGLPQVSTHIKEQSLCARILRHGLKSSG